MKVLNLYAGIGGNRKLWTKENTGLDLQITAVELDPNIAKIYQDFFPDDNVIVGDAHQYLLDNFEQYEFIWSSPPCPTHSRAAWWGTYSKSGKMNYRPKYPDMKLYQEIILLFYSFKGKFCVENVISYYEPLIKPLLLDRHYFWSNFYIQPLKLNSKHSENRSDNNKMSKELGFDISDYKIKDKQTILRNCVFPELALYIFNSMNNQELKLNL